MDDSITLLAQLRRSVKGEIKQPHVNTRELREYSGVPEASRVVGLTALGLILRDRLILALGQRPS